MQQKEFHEASDLDLARLAREGDEAAFEEIVHRFGPRVFRIAGHFFRRRELAEEAAQEAFLNAYSQLGSFEGRGSLEGWLARIATNVCINLLRRAKRRPEASVTDLTEAEARWFDQQASGAFGKPASSIEAQIVAADLAEKVLQTLSPADRTVLMLIDGDDLSVKEAAETTGWSESKVKVQAMRARRRFRNAIEKVFARKGQLPRQPDIEANK